MASSIHFEYEKYVNKSMWPIDETLMDQSGTGSYNNEEVLLT